MRKLRGPDGEDRQDNVASPGGFVHVVHNGDMHVFGDNVPLYVLRRWRRAPTCDAETLRGLPSQMLDGRNQVVRFTGRTVELDQLRRWRDGTASFAVRWLFGPGGQGKSRLADEFAAESAAAGWKVIVAEQGPGTMVAPHGVHDLAVDDAAGLLLIVDYADRWPFTHLIWLFSNGLLHTDKPTRVLLLARGTDIWPALQAALRREYNTYRIELSAQSLQPLPDDGQAREAMFRAAVSGFSDVYDVADRVDVDPPQALASPEMALTLALHMAALVGVDAKATGGRPPTNMQELTSYLIEREHLHWTIRYGDDTHELDPSERTYRTPPHVMHHAVFVAALTGSMDRAAGSGLVGRLGLPGDADRTLTDHATCYPQLPPDPATILEPLQPDRFAEDLLALSTPGHHVAYPAQNWATNTVRTLLDTPDDPPQYVSRALLYLTAATQRWPHVGDAALYPLLRARPELLVAAGNAALLSFNAIEEVDDELLYAVGGEFPRRPDPDLDIGVAAIAERLTDHRLASTTDALERAGLQQTLAWRFANAGRLDAALPRCRDAVAILSQLAAEDPAAHATALAMAINDLGSCLAEMGRVVEAGRVYEQMVTTFRAEPALPALGRLMLAGSLRNLAGIRDAEGRRRDAINLLEEAVRIHRDLLDRRTDQPDEPVHESYRAEMAAALGDLGGNYAQSRRPWRAVPLLEESARRFRLLAEQQPSAYRPELTRALISLAMIRSDSGRPREGLPIAREAEQMARELADAHPAVHLPDLAMALNNLSVIHAKAGNDAEEQAPAEEAVAIRRRLAQHNPDLYLHDLAISLLNLGAAQASAQQWSSAVDHTREAVDILRQLCEVNPLRYLKDFRNAARNLTGILLLSRRRREATLTRRENRRVVRSARRALFRAVTRRQSAGQDRPGSDGTLLVGADDPADEFYRGRVMLVVGWDESGALVVVLNHPSPLSLADVPVPDVSRWERLAATPPVVFDGGPDEPQAAICLAQLRRGADPVPGVQRLAGRLCTIDLGSDVEAVTRVVSRIRIFAGYVAFDPGELDLIIDRGDLTLHAVATTEPFHTRPERLHQELRRSATRRVT